MFEHQIEQVKQLKDKVYHCRELRNDVPDSQKVKNTELDAWFSTTKELILMVFGSDSIELKKYNTIYNSKGELIDRAMAAGDDRWEFTYWIDLFNLMVGLLYELEAKYKHLHPEVKMGDVYNVSGQVGAVGPHSTAKDINFSQVWNNSSNQLNLEILAEELAELRKHLRELAKEPEHDISVAAIAEAEVAAKSSDGPKTLEYLARAGKWALEAATKIGVSVTTEALKKSLGM